MPSSTIPVYVGTDPGVLCLSYAAMVLWPLGYPDQALQRSREALTLAHQLSHSFSLSQALTGRPCCISCAGRWTQSGSMPRQRLNSRARRSLRQSLAAGTVFRGWVLAMQGQSDEGIAEIRQGISAWQATGAEVGLTYYLTMLAEAYGKGGQTEEGLRVLAEALTLVNKNGECWREAELHRLKGELVLQQTVPDAPQAEACFQQALVIARRQQAKSWELRAAMSLSRLWQQQGKRAEARQVLAEVYGWFTEGFDTADLQEAAALLEALA